MKKILLLGTVIAVIILMIVLGQKAIENVQYAARLDDMEEWIDREYGEECHVDYDNLLITDQGAVTNVLNGNGEHVDFMIVNY